MAYIVMRTIVEQLAVQELGTQYGWNTNLTYTDQSTGATRTTNTQTLAAGDAVLNVTNGTNFNGSPTENVSVATGQSAPNVFLNHPETYTYTGSASSIAVTPGL